MEEKGEKEDLLQATSRLTRERNLVKKCKALNLTRHEEPQWG